MRDEVILLAKKLFAYAAKALTEEFSDIGLYLDWLSLCTLQLQIPADITKISRVASYKQRPMFTCLYRPRFYALHLPSFRLSAVVVYGERACNRRTEGYRQFVFFIQKPTANATRSTLRIRSYWSNSRSATRNWVGWDISHVWE